MPVAGYNVIPDENDHESVISIDLEEVNEYHKGKACVCIGEGYSQTKIHLDWHELKAHIWACNRVLREMEWKRASYAYANDRGTGETAHLVQIGNAQLEKTTFAIEPTSVKFETALCGRPAPTWTHSTDPRGWCIEPVISDNPYTEKTCKRCYAKWQKLQEA